MQLTNDNIQRICHEDDIYNSLLELDNRQILELGCGKAALTRAIATGGQGRTVTALEVDKIQHAMNCELEGLPNVTFIFAGAENIPLADESFDIVFMFKSLHHIPSHLRRQALNEVRRVLKPGGLVYISEPIFTGPFNEIFRLFHNEEGEQHAAFTALAETIMAGNFLLVEEIFFNQPLTFANFEEFESEMINVTHMEHRLSDTTYQQVKELFSAHMQADGAHFLSPMRVDLLRRPE